MRPRHTAPEVVPSDIEGGGNSYGKTISMAGSGGRPIIQPFEGHGGGDGKSKGRRGMAMDKELLQKVGLGVGGVWLLGWLLLGWDVMWPLYLVYDLLHYILSFPPFSWFSWMFGGWMSRGAPVLNHGQPIEEATLPAGQVSQYVNSYVQQYGDAALIFATNDGYPQIVKELIHNEDLGYRDLVDARDDSGNTALIYAAAKGFRQCTAALLRAGADPELPNQGNGGRTPLMEAAGGGYKDIVSALRMMPKISVDLADDHGNTALHYAAYHGHLAVVMELLKSNPNKDLKNIYGHTAASYAASNKFKGIADVLNRADPARSQRRAQEKEKADEEAAKEIEDKIREHLNQLKSKQEHEEKSKHVKGKAENLHDRDAEDFEPSIEKDDGVSESERKALEDQLTRLRRQHEEAELKSQKKIVELLEKTSEQQRALDEAKDKHREFQLNHTELQLKVDELETKHRASVLKAQEEADRAKDLADKHQEVKQELERHKQRAEALEKQRDQQEEVARRHQEHAQQAHQEVTEHLSKLEEHQKEMVALREQLKTASEEKKREEERIQQMQEELRRLRGGGNAGSAAETRTESPVSEPEKAADAPEEKN
mmetsp:Transcript_66766/g.159339  ORF Transcript_66766/g.159339 Transcript_66766/m.159339 type:complete len:598 (+) Transcript_66766:63-1856(+)